MAKTTKKLVPKKISQPNAYDNSKARIEDQHSNAIYHRHSGYLSFNCAQWGGWPDKSFRQWNHPELIIQGKKTQCGTTDKRYGSKNEVQHIGSPTGDIPRPAMLHMYNFDKSFLDTSSKIDHITITFDYRVVNVTDGGSLWTENLASNELAIIQGLDAWFGAWNQSPKLSAVQHNNTKLKYEGKNKDGYIWKTITLKFKDISASDIFNSNFAFNLQFGMNCSEASTPCFLYINNFKIEVTYESSKKYIEGKNSANSLYTSTEDGCYTTINQTIEAGYKNGKTKIAPSKAPAKLGSRIKLCNGPKGVTISKQSYNDNTAVFKITDKTNVAGEKTVTYCLDNDASTKVSLKYTAIKRPRPTYSFITEYKSQEDFNSSKAYVIFKNGCASSIKIYIDSINSTPLTLSVANQNSTTNLLNQNQIQAFHTRIKGLSCGYHTLYIQRGNETINEAKNNTVRVRILPMEYRFNIYSETDPTLKNFQQRKKNSPEHPRYAPLKIQRIDDEPRAIIPSVSILDETNLTGSVTHWTNVKKGDFYKDSNNEDYKIDLYYAGDYFLKVVEDNNTCVSQTPSMAQVSIASTHKQNYDYLFTRGEDATTFNFDYLVAWEGDNVKRPIITSDINLKHSFDDIRICSDSKEIGLSQIGLAELKVTNKTEDDDFKHVKIELNTLVKNDDDELEITTDEWLSLHGIFKDFYTLFYEFNLNDNVTVENLTPDNDLVDEENVYLHIQDIPAGDTITIYLPYRSTVEKTVYLQYLLFEHVKEIHPISKCDVQVVDTTNEIILSVIDSMQTQLDITGNTDLLNLDDTYECPNECYTTTDVNNPKNNGITYTITNIDTNDFGEQNVKTEIINDNELEPYGYYYHSQYYDINTGPLQWTQEITTHNVNIGNQLIYAYIKFPSMEEKTIVQRTNNKGVTKFFIEIPNGIGRSYTIKELLSEVLYFKFKGVDNYAPSTKSEGNNPLVQHDTPDNSKNNTIISYDNNYRRYKPGEIAYIPVSLVGEIKSIKNKLVFNAALQDSGSSDQVTVLYRICNIKDNKGVFKTIFKTNDKLLIPQEISKKIYCGMNTNIQLNSRLDKQIVEKEHLNILYINIANKDKVNKDVYVEINLGQVLPDFQGDYSFIDINIDVGDYAITDDNGNIILTWLLGEMDEYQKNKAVIKIQAEHIGISDIQIRAYDYLHTPNGDVIIRNSKCPKCQDEDTTYTIKNSPWEKIDGVWYKKINGQYYQRVLKDDGELKWIRKE